MANKIPILKFLIYCFYVRTTKICQHGVAKYANEYTEEINLILGLIIANLISSYG